MTGVSTRYNGNGKLSHHVGLVGKRIALFTGAYNHISDGVTMTLNRLVAYLEAQGAEVLVFAPTTRHPVVQHAGTLVSIPSIPFPGRPEYRLALGLSRTVRARIDAFDPHLIHIATPDYAGAQALKLAKARGIPVVASFHTHFGAYLKYFVSYHKFYRIDLLESTLWRYGRWFYPKCAHVYVPTAAIADELKSHGIESDFRLWPRGVDTEVYTPSKRSAAWRQHREIDDDEVVIAFVSRLVWEKGLQIYTDVIQGLQARGVPHRSLIVGDGPARNKLAEQLPDTIFTGHLEGENLTRAYASSDIFLFPSDTETFGNVTLEAMASGLPAVCADAPGSNALVVDGQTGFLAAPGHSDAFLEAVERLAVDPALRRQMGLSALQRARTFAWGEALARLATYYEEILRPQPAVAGRIVPASPDLGVSRSVLGPAPSL